MHLIWSYGPFSCMPVHIVHIPDELQNKKRIIISNIVCEQQTSKLIGPVKTGIYTANIQDDQPRKGWCLYSLMRAVH